jgi:hypothetical protein
MLLCVCFVFVHVGSLMVAWRVRRCVCRLRKKQRDRDECVCATHTLASGICVGQRPHVTALTHAHDAPRGAHTHTHTHTHTQQASSENRRARQARADNTITAHSRRQGHCALCCSKQHARTPTAGDGVHCASFRCPAGNQCRSRTISTTGSRNPQAARIVASSRLDTTRGRSSRQKRSSARSPT